MAFVSQAPVRRNSHLIPAGFALVVTGLLCVLHMRFLGVSWPLLWLPFAVVSLWPRQASPVPSAVLIFIGGLWVDWVTLGVPGQWPAVMLVTYAILRPDLGEPVRGVVVAYARFAQALIIGVPVFVLSGRLVYTVWPDPFALLRGIAIVIVLLPLIALVRDLAAGRLSGDD